MTKPKPAAFSERMVRAERAFQRHVIDRVPLAELAPELGVSRETVRQDVEAMRQALGADRPADLQERRAVFEAQLQDVIAKAYALYDKYKDTKPLAAVGALNTVVATFAHLRAVQGLDEPKETKLGGEVRHTIVWDDSEDFPAD